MKSSISIIALFFFCLTVAVNAQPSSLIPKEDHIMGLKAKAESINFKKKLKTPIFLIVGGVMALSDNDIISNEEVYEARQRIAPRFHSHLDDYLQYTPILAVYGLSIAGLKAKHDFKTRTSLLLKSELLMTAFVTPTKMLSKELRPDNTTSNAFPSGHTAQAFVAATFLHREYGHINKWYSISGYLAASTVGLMRIANNRHWVSDVLVGAGLGILTTQLVYLTHKPHVSKNNKKRNILILPTYREKNLELIMQFTF